VKARRGHSDFTRSFTQIRRSTIPDSANKKPSAAQGRRKAEKTTARGRAVYFAKTNFAVWDLARAAAFLWTTPDLVALSIADT
jgi:hypothetical protein